MDSVRLLRAKGDADRKKQRVWAVLCGSEFNLWT